MSEIADLERRITSALERIGAAIEATPAGADDSAADAVAELQAALAEEKTANAQLEERLQTLKDREAADLTELRNSNDVLSTRAANQEREMVRVLQINAQLRDNNQKLREANASGVADPTMINAAMQSELEALRLAHAAQKSELDALIAQLQPIVEDTKESA